jgi:hypothetical protein
VTENVSKYYSEMLDGHHVSEECETLVCSRLYYRPREVVSRSFWGTFPHRNGLALVKKVVPVWQEVVTVEVLSRSHVGASQKGFWGEHFEAMETDGEEEILAARLFVERNGVEVFLLLEHMYHLYLCPRDFVIACGSLLANDCGVELPSDL